MEKDFTLPHSERLRGEITVSHLFAEGRGGFYHPVRYVFRMYEVPDGDGSATGDGAGGVRVLFSVPKKNFKRAVKRNFLRRRMKEAYRLNKDILHTVYESQEKPVIIDVALIYAGKELSDYKTTEKGIKRILAEISKQIGAPREA